MKLIKNKNIAIVGGGPGGLTLARILQMNGAEVKVYERDENRHVRVQGATLDLHTDSGLKALSVAGLMDQFKANFRPGADKMRITDKYARILFEDEFAVDENDEFSRPEIDRGPLREILLDSLQPDTVIWQSNFLSLCSKNNAFRLEFKNGTEAFADIVIAADGASSGIRPYITPIKPFYAGITALEGSVFDAQNQCPEIHRLTGEGKIFAMGDEKTLIIGSKGDGSLMFYAGFKCDESWPGEYGIDFSSKAQVLAWFKKEFTGWDGIWDDLFEQAGTNFIPRPQYCMPFDQCWDALPNLTMLGDAAHLMPPYAGEGVNMAMLDALELAECLLGNEFPDTLSAIAVYEKQMRKRASGIAKMTMEQTASLHSPQAISNLLAMLRPVE